MSRVRYILSWVLWPALMTICMVGTAYGFEAGYPIITFNICYVFLITALFLLEKYMPHEREWLKPDGQNIASILHTLSSKGSVQLLFMFSGIIGLAELITPVMEPGFGIWPRDWPMWLQVIVGVTLAEFGLYWVHRLGHTTAWMWRFHAVHHSVTKLWFLNTGRFHFVDSLASIVIGLAILIPLGAPMEVIQWLTVITAFIGMLTHCNVEMRFGPINYIFNTPALHRWHHSKQLFEGNRNYCENVMLWDHVFGTFYHADYRPPAEIGMSDYMPDKFIHQLMWPFLTTKQKQKIIPEYEHIPFGYEDREESEAQRLAKLASLRGAAE